MQHPLHSQQGRNGGPGRAVQATLRHTDLPSPQPCLVGVEAKPQPICWRDRNHEGFSSSQVLTLKRVPTLRLTLLPNQVDFVEQDDVSKLDLQAGKAHFSSFDIFPFFALLIRVGTCTRDGQGRSSAAGGLTQQQRQRAGVRSSTTVTARQAGRQAGGRQAGRQGHAWSNRRSAMLRSPPAASGPSRSCRPHRKGGVGVGGCARRLRGTPVAAGWTSDPLAPPLPPAGKPSVCLSLQQCQCWPC